MVGRGWATALVLTFVALGGCDLQLDEDPPRRARVVVTSTGGAEASLLASLDFIIDSDGGVDTGLTTPSIITLPFEQTYDLLQPPRLFVRIAPPDSLTTLGVTLEVFFDGDRFISQSETIGSGQAPAIEFLYRYHLRVF